MSCLSPIAQETSPFIQDQAVFEDAMDQLPTPSASPFMKARSSPRVRFASARVATPWTPFPHGNESVESYFSVPAMRQQSPLVPSTAAFERPPSHKPSFTLGDMSSLGFLEAMQRQDSNSSNGSSDSNQSGTSAQTVRPTFGRTVAFANKPAHNGFLGLGRGKKAALRRATPYPTEATRDQDYFPETEETIEEHSADAEELEAASAMFAGLGISSQ